MIDTLIGLGMFGILIFIATKMAVINDVTHRILEKMEDK